MKESTFGSSELVTLFERKEVCEIKDVLNSEGSWEERRFIGKEVHLEAKSQL